MGMSKKHSLGQRPSLEAMESFYRRTKLVTWAVSLALTFVLIIVWPVVTISAGAMNQWQFSIWVCQPISYLDNSSALRSCQLLISF